MSTPLGDNARYDAIVDIAGKLFRVQVKTLTDKKNGTFCFNTRSLDPDARGKTSYVGDVDLFFAFNEEHDIYVLMDIGKVGDAYQVKVRNIPGKNNQTVGVNFISDFVDWDF